MGREGARVIEHKIGLRVMVALADKRPTPFQAAVVLRRAVLTDRSTRDGCGCSQYRAQVVVVTDSGEEIKIKHMDN